MGKKKYISMSIVNLRMEGTGAIMTGSITNVPIEVGNVAVDNYEQGFDISGNDFKDISFD